MVVHGTWRWNYQWETEETFREATESTETNKYQGKKNPRKQYLKNLFEFNFGNLYYIKGDYRHNILCICAGFGLE